MSGQSEQASQYFDVMFPCDDGIRTHKGFGYDGKLWMILDSLVNRALQQVRPLRIMRFDNQSYSVLHLETGYMLAAPIPKSVLEGGMLEGYEFRQGAELANLVIQIDMQ